MSRPTGAIHAIHATHAIDRLRGRGEPLSPSVRRFVEPRFGRDFSNVRIHTGGDAASTSRALDARAFTVGNDVVFGESEYQPETPAGRHLLAHELTHVLQQRSAGTSSVDHAGGVYDSASHEREADDLAAIVARGDSVHGWSPRAATPGRQQRSWLGDRVGDALDLGGDVIEGGLDLGGSVIEGGLDLGGDIVAGGLDLGGDIIGGGLEAAGDLTGSETLSHAGQSVNQGLHTAGDAVDDAANATGHFVHQGLNAVGGTVNAGLDVAADFARHGVTFSLPDVSLCPKVSHTFQLGSYGRTIPLLAGGLAMGPVILTGSVGLRFEASPSLQLALGPCRLTNISVTIDPFGRSSATARLSIGAGAGLGVMLKAGIRAEVGLTIIVPIGGIPIPIEFPLASLDVGGFGFALGSVITQLALQPTIGFRLPGLIDLDLDTDLDIGGAIDLWAGVFGSLSTFDRLLCSIIWPLVSYHADGGFRVSLGLSGAWLGGVGTGLLPTGVSVTPIPFASIETALKREPPKSKCPITDFACEWLELLGLLPHQRGGQWSWTGPYGPGAPLAGPLAVYQRNPGIPSGALCRGACGPDCNTCEHHPTYSYTDPATGKTWTYTNFEICNTHPGCQQHDAAFDWAADVHGERGGGLATMVKPWHMAANIECTCSYDPANCIAWILGMPPHTGTLYFAESATSGGPGGGAKDCKEAHPDALDCTPGGGDREIALEVWGSAYGFSDFRGFAPTSSFAAGEHVGCETASGRIWQGTATDVLLGSAVTIGIFECACCEPTSALRAEWKNPHVILTGGLIERVLLRLCDRGLLPAVICEEVYRRVRERFGDEHRDPDLDPDTDVHQGGRRSDDAPVLDSFRRAYNRLDSWNIYIRHRHESWYPEFDTQFHLDAERTRWLAELKAATSESSDGYKARFRDLSTFDVEAERRRYTDETLRRIEHEIDELNHQIALWYRNKTGSTEDLDTLIERIHAEGTELWRQLWLAAILAVNRVLSRLWPPARGRLEAFMALQRRIHPDVDLSGSIGELSYIGSLARGYKGPPKQYVRFNPEKFDVDANLEAPPLEKYAVNIDHLAPDRGRIFGRTTSIAPLNQFSDQTHLELRQEVEGYDGKDPFDVAIDAAPLPPQQRQTDASERIYQIRERLLAAHDEPRYRRMIDELNAAGLLVEVAGRPQVRPDLTDAEFQRLTAILDRYDPTSGL